MFRKKPFKTDDMLQSEDIIQLRGIAHRNIRAGLEPTSAALGVVKDNINYFVNDVKIMGSMDGAAVFGQIII